jgi:hypothetical protein
MSQSPDRAALSRARSLARLPGRSITTREGVEMAGMSGIRGSRIRSALALPLVVALAGCAAIDFTRVGEAWAKNACLRNPDEVARTRCVDDSGKAYEAARHPATLARE